MSVPNQAGSSVSIERTQKMVPCAKCIQFPTWYFGGYPVVSHIHILSQSQSGWWISHGLGESSWIFLAFLRMCVCIFRLSIPPQNMCLFHIINSRSLAKHFQEKTNSKQLRLSPVPRTAEVPGVDHPLGTKSIVEAHCPWFRSTGRVSHPASRP